MQLRLGFALALTACAPSSDGPPESIEVHGPLVGTFYSLTTLGDDRVDTTLVMSVSEVRVGCGRIDLDAATVTIDDEPAIAMTLSDSGIYEMFHRDPASVFTMEAVRGADTIRATVTPPEAFTVTIADEVVRWSPSGSPDTTVHLTFVGPGTAITRATDDTGEYVPTADDLDQPGEWTVTVEKRRTSEPWCAEFETPGDSRTCCGGFWNATVNRDATGLLR